MVRVVMVRRVLVPALVISTTVLVTMGVWSSLQRAVTLERHSSLPLHDAAASSRVRFTAQLTVLEAAPPPPRTTPTETATAAVIATAAAAAAVPTESTAPTPVQQDVPLSEQQSQPQQQQQQQLSALLLQDQQQQQVQQNAAQQIRLSSMQQAADAAAASQVITSAALAPLLAQAQPDPITLIYRQNLTPPKPARGTAWYYQFKYTPGWPPLEIPRRPFLSDVVVSHSVVLDPLPDYSKCQNYEGSSANNEGGAVVASSSSSSGECPPIVTNIVLFKTHKCASTTMAALLFRFGVRHHLRFYVSSTHYLEFSSRIKSEPVNLSTYHHRMRPGLYNFTEVTSWYRTRIPKPQFVTIMRDPLQRALSEWHYLIQPDAKNATLAEVIGPDYRDPPAWHTIALDLGIYNDAEMAFFMNEGYKQFAFIALVEQFDESMVLMRRLFGWSTEDIMYLPLLDSCTDRWRSYDFVAVECPKKVQHPPETIEMVRKLVANDFPIYELAKREFQKKLDAQGPDFWEEVRAFKDLQKQLTNDCPSHAIVKPTTRQTMRSSSQQYRQRLSQTTNAIGNVLWGAPAPSTEPPATPPPPTEPPKPLHPRCPQYFVNDLQLERIIKYSRGSPTVDAFNAEANRLYGAMEER